LSVTSSILVSLTAHSADPETLLGVNAKLPLTTAERTITYSFPVPIRPRQIESVKQIGSESLRWF